MNNKKYLIWEKTSLISLTFFHLPKKVICGREMRKLKSEKETMTNGRNIMLIKNTILVLPNVIFWYGKTRYSKPFWEVFIPQ